MDGNLQLNFAIFRPYGRKIVKFNTSSIEFRYFSVYTNTDSVDGATLLSKVVAQTKRGFFCGVRIEKGARSFMGKN